MAREHASLLAFNRGEVSKHALARVDVERLRLSAEKQRNWLPYTLGPMTLRGGMQHVASTAGDDSARILPFVKSNSDTALIELTDEKLRVLVDDAVVTRGAVSTAVVNGDFSLASATVISSATRIGDMTGGGNLAAAFDGTTSTALASCASKAAATAAAIGLDLSASPKRFGRAEIHGSNNQGYVNSINPTVTVVIRGSHTAPSDYGTDGTQLATLSFADTANESAARQLVSSDEDTLWEYLWARITHNGASQTMAVGELKLFEPNWTLTASAGCSAEISGGKLNLTATARGGLVTAVRALAIAGGDQNDEHALRIVIERGPVELKVGTTSGDDDLIGSTFLGTGEHSLTFTPPGATAYIYLGSNDTATRIVDSVTIEAAGAMELPTPWTEADLMTVRADQSGDVVFVACHGLPPMKIERRATRSWSVVTYDSNEGPFLRFPSAPMKFTPGAISGNTTLSSERAYFTADHVGCLFRLFSAGQLRKAVLGAADAYSDPIRVVGVGATQRGFKYKTTGTWSGRLTLQRSVESADAGFTDVTSITANTAAAGVVLADGFDNLVCWYRLGFKTGDYTSGAATVSFHSNTTTITDLTPYAAGGGAGICRVTGYVSPTSVNVEVLQPFASLAPTAEWLEGEWSELTFWPSAVTFFDGRLWWAGADRIWGSASDAYYNHDADEEGDSAAINRSVGFGPVDRINWLLPLSRLLVGREGAELSVRSSYFGEPLTPTNFTLKDSSTQGSDRLPAVKIDTRGLFVQRSGRRVYELAYDVQVEDYSANDLTRLNLDIGDVGFVDVAVQRQPDTHVYLVRGDGECAVLLYDKADQAEGWWRIVTDGAIENVAVLPGVLEDRVYFVVRRTINGQTKRFIEKMARRDQCTGPVEARLADSHVMYSGAAVTTIGGLSHLEGETVVVWGWNTATPFTATLADGTTQTVGRDFGTFTVTAGQITGLAAAVTDACIGLPYEATYKSAKLAYGGIKGTSLTQKKQLDRVGLLLLDTHYQGLRYGQDENHLDDLPAVEDSFELSPHTVWDAYDKPTMPLNGTWSTDSRLVLKAAAPRPCTVQAVVVGVTTNED